MDMYSATSDNYPANTKHEYNICTTSVQRLRRRSNIVQSYANVLCVLCNVSNDSTYGRSIISCHTPLVMFTFSMAQDENIIYHITANNVPCVAV